MSNIEPADRAREAQEAWRLWIGGKSKAEIARRLSRNPRTVTTYLEEAAEWVRDEGLETKRAAIVSSHRKIVEKAWEMIESGEIRPTSLAGPQYLMQIREALKEIARIEGLYIERKEIKHGLEGQTLKDILIPYFSPGGAGENLDPMDVEEVEYEIIEDDGPPRLP